MELLGEHSDWLDALIPRTAIAIVVGTLPAPQEVDSMVATALAEAAGVMGRRQWALILSSSARVSQITYKTVFAVRYPELDSKGTDEVHFGTYLADQQATVGGFLPMFWKAHFSPVHASADLSLMVDWITAHYFTLSASQQERTVAWQYYTIGMTWSMPSTGQSG